jgi:SAM-dependent methyltransferase
VSEAEGAMRFDLRRRVEALAAAHPALRRALTIALFLRKDLVARGARAPIDRDYGVWTQRTVPLYLSRTGTPSDDHIVPYAGCVPSVLRWAIESLSAVDGATFLDIGCGKGRALIVASEYAFARLIGIELNPEVAALGRMNARRVARRHPDRAPIEIRTGDASAPDLPDGDLVVFMYHPFGRPLVERLCRLLVDSLASGRSISVIYENPVHSDIFDVQPAFHRWRAEMRECTAEEAPFAFDSEDATVIWRSVADAPAARVAARPIIVVKPEWRVILGP